MGKWNPQVDNKLKRNIPATPGTYNSVPYHIGLLKNGEPTTITISDFTITKSKWIKDVSLGEKSSNGNYYPLTYEVEENSDTSEREGIISIMHKDANKSIEYLITLAAKPTLNEYVFLITDYTNNSRYSLQVCGYSADPDNNVSFATIKANNINDSTLLSIDIKISLAATAETSGRPLTFEFIIRGDGFKFDSSIDNPRPTGNKLVDIIHNGETKGKLNISNIVGGGLEVRIIISSNNLDPKSKALALLSENITGTIAIKNSTHVIPFKVTFGFS